MVIVEDDASIPTALQRVLPDFEILHIEKPGEVIRSIELLQDVVGVVSDSPGIGLATEIKSRFKIPFIVYSAGYPSEKPGVDEWITKPDRDVATKIKRWVKHES